MMMKKFSHSSRDFKKKEKKLSRLQLKLSSWRSTKLNLIASRARETKKRRKKRKAKMICLELNLMSRRLQQMLIGPLLPVIMIGNLVLCPKISVKKKNRV